MPTDVLIRDLPEGVLKALSIKMRPGQSQVDFLREQLTAIAEGAGRTDDLFAQRMPENMYGKGLPFTFIDLFAGIGGFRCAMSALGGSCVFTSEWDRFSARTYSEWYRDNHIFTDDVRNVDSKSDIPDHDILCAGFPCQPFSLAGVSKKQSLGRKHGFDDENQGNLFFTILNIIDAKRPPALLLENVKNLVSHDKGNTWRVIRNELTSRGYSVHANVVDARSWVPQHRERIFIVCFDDDVFSGLEQEKFSFPDTSGHTAPKLGDILSDKAPDRRYMLSDKLWNYLQEYAEKHRKKGNGFGYGLFGRSDVARTLSARYHKDGSEVLIKQRGWRNPRRLTPSEACQLMGFERRYAQMFGHNDGFPQVVSDTQAYRQFGNAVVPPVVEDVAKGMLEVFRAKLTGDNGCLFKTSERVSMTNKKLGKQHSVVVA